MRPARLRPKNADKGKQVKLSVRSNESLGDSYEASGNVPGAAFNL